MPYLHSLGQRCSYFTDWTETDTDQESLTQYVGQVDGSAQPGTVNDCQAVGDVQHDADKSSARPVVGQDGDQLCGSRNNGM